MRQLRHAAPMPLRRRGYEHLHEVDEREEYAEGHHEGEQEPLIAAHVADVAEDRFQRVRVILC